MSQLLPRPKKIFYPDSDEQPLPTTNKKLEAMVDLKQGFETFFAGRPDVFVAGGLPWFPIEGRPEIRHTPSVLIAFGRPKGPRDAYRQWEEGGIAPQVVFEVNSPDNPLMKIVGAIRFYERCGVEELYVHNPDQGVFEAFRRVGNRLTEVTGEAAWSSPRLGVQFVIVYGELHVIGPDCRPFVTFAELIARADQERRRADALAAEVERLRERLQALGQPPSGSNPPT